MHRLLTQNEKKASNTPSFAVSQAVENFETAKVVFLICIGGVQLTDPSRQQAGTQRAVCPSSFGLLCCSCNNYLDQPFGFGQIGLDRGTRRRRTLHDGSSGQPRPMGEVFFYIIGICVVELMEMGRK